MYRIVPCDDSGPLGALWHTRALGASVAEIVLKGRNRWMDEHKLWRYIRGDIERDPMSEAAQEGLDCEPRICELWEKATGRQYQSANLIDGEYDFLRAQIDGLSWDLTAAVDYKTSRSVTVWAAAEKLQRNFIMAEGPLNYWFPAAQHQLMILGLEHIDYVLYDPTKDRILPFIVKRDEAFIKQYRGMTMGWWFQHVVSDQPPPRNRKLKLVPDEVAPNGL